MAFNNSVFTSGGMSNTPIPAPQSQLQQTSFLTSSFTASQFDNSSNGFNQGTGGGTLQYPLDMPKYIMTFTIANYSRQDLNSVGQLSYGNYPAIVMPLPSPLIDSNHVNWAEVEVGTVTGTAISAGATAITNINQGISSIGSLASGVGKGLAAGATAVGVGVANQLDSGAAGGVESLLGISPNQFVTLLMKGPTYKRHKFTWTCSPQNLAEADKLREIARTFKNAMSPLPYGAMVGNAPVLWQFPKIFQIRLYPNSLFMYKFKPCICDYFTVNYSPAGRNAFYRDSTGSGTAAGLNAPEAVSIDAHFIELEYWVEGNFSASNDPTDNYSQSDTQTIATTVNNSTNYPINNLSSGGGSVGGNFNNPVTGF